MNSTPLPLLLRRSPPRRAARASPRGFGLVELMVSMAIGLVVVGAAVVLLLGTRQANTQNDNLSRVAETARTSYDLLARELREAGSSPCDTQLPVTNVLVAAQGATPTWWAVWGDAVTGFDGATAMPAAAFGTAVGQRISNTGALLLRASLPIDGVTVTAHATGTSTMTTNPANHGVNVGENLMICNYRQASVFQATAVNPVAGTLTHGVGAASNCGAGLGLPMTCSPGVQAYDFSPEGRLGRLVSSAWYIGANGRPETGGRSLFRATRMGNEEVAEGVQDLQATFLVTGGTNYVAPASVTDWGQVVALRLTLTLVGPDARSATTTANEGRLTRTLSFTLQLRNQMP